MNAEPFIRQLDNVTDALQMKLASCRESRRVVHAEHARKEIRRIAKEARHSLTQREEGSMPRPSASVSRWGHTKFEKLFKQLEAAEEIALQRVEQQLQAIDKDIQRGTN